MRGFLAIVSVDTDALQTARGERPILFRPRWDADGPRVRDDRDVTDTGGWSLTDSLVLASIISASRSEHPDLAGVLQFGDYFNRTVLTRQELESSVGRLRQSGFVDRSNPLVPVDTSLRMWEDVQRDDGAVRAIQRMRDALNVHVAPDQHPEPWSLDPQDYRSADQLYRERFDAALSRIRRLSSE
jgi:hypothetical protein